MIHIRQPACPWSPQLKQPASPPHSKPALSPLSSSSLLLSSYVLCSAPLDDIPAGVCPCRPSFFTRPSTTHTKPPAFWRPFSQFCWSVIVISITIAIVIVIYISSSVIVIIIVWAIKQCGPTCKIPTSGMVGILTRHKMTYLHTKIFIIITIFVSMINSIIISIIIVMLLQQNLSL